MKALKNNNDILEDISEFASILGYLLMVILLVFFVAYLIGPQPISNDNVTYGIYAKSVDGVTAMLVMCVAILVLEFVSLITRMLGKTKNGKTSNKSD